MPTYSMTQGAVDEVIRERPVGAAAAPTGCGAADGRQQDERRRARRAKKGSGIPSVTAAEVNDMALCHGWIPGQRKSLDGSHFLPA